MRILSGEEELLGEECAAQRSPSEVSPVDDSGEESKESGYESEDSGPDEWVQTSIRVGEIAMHDFLGMGTVLAIGATQDVAEGMLRGDATFDSLGLAADKVRFKFTKRERVPGTGPKRFIEKETVRDVCADALTPAVTNDPTVEEESPNTFNTMAEAASSSGAFTHGLAGPELAAHERKRKVLNLKDAPVCGHNKQGRKTKEPNVTPEARISQFPNQSLRVDNGKLCCVACGTDRSLRLSSLKIHLDSGAHTDKLEKYRESLEDDGDISALVTRFFEQNPPEGASLPSDTHLYR